MTAEPTEGLAAEIAGWLARESGAGVGSDTVVGRGGVRLTLGGYLRVVDLLADRCGVDPARLLDLRPPVTPRALAWHAVRAGDRA